MANYTASNLAVGQAKLNSAFQNEEMRYRDPVVWKSLLGNQMLATPNYEALRTREDRSYEVNFFNRTSRALGTGRTHNPVGARGDSSIITPSFATKSDAFANSIKQADNSIYSLQEEFNEQMMNTVINFVEGLEDLSANFLFNNRSGVNGVTQEGAFSAANDVFEIAAADEERAIQITKTVMDILKYQGTALDIYCDTLSFNKFEYLRAQGGANSVNTAYQFDSGGLTFYHVPDMNAEVAALAAGIYNQGFWIAAPKGMTVALDWIPKQNRNGVDSVANREYGNIINPIDGANYALYKKFEASDETANNGFTQDILETTEISIDVAFQDAPLTTAGETILQAFAIQ